MNPTGVVATPDGPQSVEAALFHNRDRMDCTLALAVDPF
jgi:hypothetical protein